MREPPTPLAPAISTSPAHEHIAFWNSFLLRVGRSPPPSLPAASPISQTKSNNIKVVQVGDFNPEKLEQLNSTIQQDWKLYERVLADHKPVSVDDIVSTPNGDRKR